MGTRYDVFLHRVQARMKLLSDMAVTQIALCDERAEVARGNRDYKRAEMFEERSAALSAFVARLADDHRALLLASDGKEAPGT